jgi:hypothetical protein
MRKTAVLAAIVLALAAADVGALDIAIGAGFRYQLAFVTDFVSFVPEQESTVALDLRATPYPLQLGVSYSRVLTGPFAAPTMVFENFGLSADWWLLDGQLGKLPLSAHLGAGVWVCLPVVGFGVRGSAGLRWTPISSDKGFEVWAELVPVIGMYAIPTILPTATLKAGGSAGLGLRYWIGR